MGVPALKVYAFPIRFSLLGWRGVSRETDSIMKCPVDLTKNFDSSGGQFDYLPDSSPELTAARSTRIFQIFGSFNQVPFWRVSPVVDAEKVELIDLRFGTAAHPGSRRLPMWSTMAASRMCDLASAIRGSAVIPERLTDRR